MRIFLTGFMGAGKTTVGKHLAGDLALPFFDLDEEIERRVGMTVREIFEQRGEPEFRRLEHEHLAMMCAQPKLVVATGGGTVTVEANRELIERTGLCVWLHPPFAVIAQRVQSMGKEDRPLFQSEVQAWSLYRERLAAYRRCDLRVDIEADEKAEEVAARIALIVRKRLPCVT